MISRERVEIALEHKEPDRVPADITLSVFPYKEICKYYGIQDEWWWDDWNHAYPKPEVLNALGVDVYHVPLMLEFDNHKYFDMAHDDEFLDEWGIKKFKEVGKKGDFLYQLGTNPLKNASSVDEILSYQYWPGKLTEKCLDELEKRTKKLYEETDFALTATFGGNIFERSHYLRSMEQFMMDLILEPEIAEALMSKICEIQMAVDKAILERIGKYLTYFRFNGEDLGTQESQLISTDTFREHVRPYLEKEWKTAKELFHKQNPKGKIAIHSCGSVINFMNDFIDMGADILNPIQPNAKNMETDKIKAQFGDRLSFHGAIDSQNILNNGTPEQMKEEVKKRIFDLAPNGGYIAAPSHNVQASAPIENIIALFDAIKEYGRYPIGK